MNSFVAASRILTVSNQHNLLPSGQLTDHNFSDPTCVLLAPRRPFTTIPKSVADKVMVCLATRFDSTINQVRRYVLPEYMEQFASVRRLEGGDTMHASTFARKSEDRRDASFIRVSYVYIF